MATDVPASAFAARLPALVTRLAGMLDDVAAPGPSTRPPAGSGQGDDAAATGSAATGRLGEGRARRRVVVGLVGAPGSGKSTLATELEAALAARGILAGSVPMDGFHLSNAVLDQLGRHGRKGAPDTFDVDGYLSTLDRVREPAPPGAPLPEVLAPVYRRDLHEPVAAGSRISGDGVVVTEGNYLALTAEGWEGVRERIDWLVMLDVPEDELVRRLVARHQAFGRSAADAGHWVRTVDVPNLRLVAATAGRCDEVWRLP